MITTRNALFDELEIVRSQGFAVDDEEQRLGFFCTGVPVLTETKIVGAISISGPKSRMLDGRSAKALATQATETATNIELNITGI